MRAYKSSYLLLIKQSAYNVVQVLCFRFSIWLLGRADLSIECIKALQWFNINCWTSEKIIKLFAGSHQCFVCFFHFSLVSFSVVDKKHHLPLQDYKLICICNFLSICTSHIWSNFISIKDKWIKFLWFLIYLVVLRAQMNTHGLSWFSYFCGSLL